jgi:intein-encoded DNA endonuclease-like protein
LAPLIVDLLTVSRKNNKKLGITGMLLYIDETYFQVLEGNEESLHKLYKIIEYDKRQIKQHSFCKFVIPSLGFVL